jgi:hypothetical protein
MLMDALGSECLEDGKFLYVCLETKFSRTSEGDDIYISESFTVPLTEAGRFFGFRDGSEEWRDFHSLINSYPAGSTRMYQPFFVVVVVPATAMLRIVPYLFN